MSRARVHMDATKPGQPLRMGLCLMLGVDTESDVSQVTCKACLRLLAARKAPASDRKKRGAATKSEVTSALASAFAATLVPSAGPPPRLTPEIWAASCKGAEHRRCGDCAICLWEREVQLWASVSAWNRTHAVRRPEGAPRWSSLAAAFVALAEWERHDRCGPSALGGILARIERGDVSDGGASRPDDPLLHRAGELVRIRQALEQAYPVGAHATLSAPQCMALLLARTPGVLPAVPPFEELAESLTATVGELRLLVRSGRQRVTEDLAARGLIPVPRTTVRRERGSLCLGRS